MVAVQESEAHRTVQRRAAASKSGGRTRKPSRWLAVLAVVAAIIVGSQVANQSAASADAQGCSSASGGYVCTYVGGSGRYVNYVTASRGKNGSICRSSAWIYSISPAGAVTGLGYQSRANCAMGRAWFSFTLNRSFPSGTRICSKFMEGGAPVGGEPCLWIR